MAQSEGGRGDLGTASPGRARVLRGVAWGLAWTLVFALMLVVSVIVHIDTPA